MKKILFLLAFVPLVSFGQFSKETKFIGGTMAYTSFKDNNNGGSPPSSTYFSFESQLGFFVNESFSIGPVLGAYANNLPTINPVTNLFENRKFNGFSGGVFARKFYKVSEHLLFSLEEKAMVGNVSRSESFFQTDSRNTRFLFSFRPVFTFMPQDRWAFDAGIGEISYSINWNNMMADTDHFTANLGQVRLGVNYFFNRIEK